MASTRAPCFCFASRAKGFRASGVRQIDESGTKNHRLPDQCERFESLLKSFLNFLIILRSFSLFSFRFEKERKEPELEAQTPVETSTRKLFSISFGRGEEREREHFFWSHCFPFSLRPSVSHCEFSAERSPCARAHGKGNELYALRIYLPEKQITLTLQNKQLLP